MLVVTSATGPGKPCSIGSSTDITRHSRRMAESAALLVDEVFPEQPMRQWVLSFPYPLRFLFAGRPEIMDRVGRRLPRERDALGQESGA